MVLGDLRLGAGMLPLLDDEGEIDFDAAKDREMGSFLGTWVESQVEEEAESPLCFAAVASSKGARQSMEDAHCMALKDDVPGIAAFGVFDGHGGYGCSKFVANEFQHIMDDMVQNSTPRTSDTGGKKPAPLPTDSNIVQLCSSVDAKFLHEQGGQDSAVEDASGSTGTMIFLGLKVLPSGETVYKVKAGNVGDSRSIVVRGRKPVAMTRDHKPSDPIEKDRIRKAGGWVAQGRVDGKLAVSRSFGDTYYKQSDSESGHKVICTPEVSEITLSPGDLVIIGCDGVFESGITDPEATQLVLDVLSNHKNDVGLAAKHLCDESLLRGSTDNVTCMVIQLKPIPQAFRPESKQMRKGFHAPPIRPFSTSESKLEVTIPGAAATAPGHASPIYSASAPLVRAPQNFLRLVVLEKQPNERDFGFTLAQDGEPQQPTSFATSQDYHRTSVPVHVCERWNKVSSVREEGPAHRAWLRAGMTILSVDGRPVTHKDTFLRTVARLGKEECRKVSFTVKADASAWARVRRERVCGGTSFAEKADSPLLQKRGRRVVRESPTGAKHGRSLSESSGHSLTGSMRSPPNSARSMRKSASLHSMSNSGPIALLCPPPAPRDPSATRKKKDKVSRSHSTAGHVASPAGSPTTFAKKRRERSASPGIAANRTVKNAAANKPLFLRSCAPPLLHSRGIRSNSRDKAR